MKIYKLITNGHYVQNKETVLENIQTLEEFEKKIHEVARGYHRDFDSVAFAVEEQGENRIIFKNLLYTGLNCDSGVIPVEDSNGEIKYQIKDLDDTLYPDEESALKFLTDEDYSGEIYESFCLLMNIPYYG